MSKEKELDRTDIQIALQLGLRQAISDTMKELGVEPLKPLSDDELCSLVNAGYIDPNGLASRFREMYSSGELQQAFGGEKRARKVLELVEAAGAEEEAIKLKDAQKPAALLWRRAKALFRKS